MTQYNPQEVASYQTIAHALPDTILSDNVLSDTAQPTQTSACGKAIIVGEHAVVYGAKAVAMPIPQLRLQIQLRPALDPMRSPHSSRLFFAGRSVPEHLEAVLADAFKALDIEAFAADFEGNTSVLVGAGLGSSASLCVAVLKAIAAAKHLPISASKLAALANHLERRFHGNPSGLDTAVVAHEQVIAFRKNLVSQTPDITPIQVHSPNAKYAMSEPQTDQMLPWRFMLIDSSTRSSTAAMIQVAAPHFTGAAGAQRLQRFDALADQALNGLCRGAADTLADAMSAASRELQAIGVVNPELLELIDLAHRHGALAAKPTGAGGGGCILALLDPFMEPAQAATHIQQLRDKLGNRVLTVDLSGATLGGSH